MPLRIRRFHTKRHRPRKQRATAVVTKKTGIRAVLQKSLNKTISELWITNFPNRGCQCRVVEFIKAIWIGPMLEAGAQTFEVGPLNRLPQPLIEGGLLHLAMILRAYCWDNTPKRTFGYRAHQEHSGFLLVLEPLALRF